MDEEYQEEQIDLRDYLRVLLKRRWLIFTIFMIVVLTVAIHTFSATPIYQATARIVIEKENPNVVSIQEVMAVDTTGSDYYQTQYKIIESRTVAREVIKRLDLENSLEFFPPPKDDIISNAKQWVQDIITFWKDWVKSIIRTELPEEADVTDEAGEYTPDSDLVSDFINRINVQPIRNSRLVDINMEAKAPKLAASMVNELVRTYIDKNLEIKLEAAKDAVKWLTERIEEERKKVEAAENDLLRYKEKHEIITDFSSDAEKITAEKLAQLNAQVVEAESNRVGAETRYQQALALEDTPEMLDSIPEVLKNELVRDIKKMEVNLYNRSSELSKKYGKNHPKMVAIRSELKELTMRKAQEVKRVVGSLRNEYRLAVAKEESLRKALNMQKTESLALNKKAIQFGVLKRQAESSRNMYELLVKRFKETSLTEEMKTGNIRIIDKAEVPRYPIKPKKKMNLLLAMVVGLTLGIGFAFFLEYLDNTIKLSEEVKSQLRIPYLGLVPAYTTNGDFDGIAPDLVTVHSPKSTASESFRGIRTSILFTSADHSPQVVLISSAGPEEGKTACVSNLAVAMAQSGSRVVLLDCDMRRPRVHQIFEIPRDSGISSFLVGTDELKEVVRRTPIKDLDVIASGPIPPNPSEMLGSKKMKALIEALRKDYDRILIDTPPITAVTDTSVLAPLSDGVILIVRAGVTPKPLIQTGLGQLQSVNARLLGAVLNGVQTGRDSYYYYQYYYYYYGEDGHRKRKQRKKDKNATSSAEYNS
ncbi:MAG TPA: polysaccharide biosynthesis tyrosine autokinase [Deltaproteobacteria bacterium]|nr:polysaccharide biosynthesis tyrosine autokinase [Deltaproteobacteria bacterium]